LGIHCQKPEQAILISLVPATVELGYNNNSMTSQVPARYNTELFGDTFKTTEFQIFHTEETLHLYV
jgi:hypothetical protein